MKITAIQTSTHVDDDIQKTSTIPNTPSSFGRSSNAAENIRIFYF